MPKAMRDEIEILSEDCLRKKDAEKIFNQIFELMNLQDQQIHELTQLLKDHIKSKDGQCHKLDH